MMIDRFLPQYQVSSRHRTLVRAPAQQVYQALFAIDPYDSWPTKILFALRGLPNLFRRRRQPRPKVTLEQAMQTGFILLGQEPDREVLLGLVGQFWKPSGGLQRLDTDGFAAFAAPGFAKAVWSFALIPLENGTMVETQTRVYCTDEGSLRRFRAYWALVGPFSGLIRMELLRLLRRYVEAK